MEELVVHGQCRTSELVEVLTDSLGCADEQITAVFQAMVAQRLVLRVQPWDLREAELLAELKAAKAPVSSAGRAASKSLLLAVSASSGTAASSVSVGPAWSATGDGAAASVRKRKLVEQPSAPSEKRGRNELPPEMMFRMLESASVPSLETGPPLPQTSSSVPVASKSGRGGRGGGRNGGRGGRGGASREVAASGAAASATTDGHEHISEESLAPTEDTLWCLGSEAFDEHHRSSICCQLVLEKFGSWRAKQVLGSMLKLSSSKGDGHSVVSVQQVFDDLNSGDEEGIERELLIQFIHMLESDSVSILTRVGTSRAVDGRTEFSVNVSAMVQFLQERTMHSILTERYETQNPAMRGVCSRIYEVLRKVKYAEQNQIAEMAMIPMKEARIHLYRMYKDKFITYQVWTIPLFQMISSSDPWPFSSYARLCMMSVQEVPRRDHNPETTIFLWRINDAKKKNEVVIGDSLKTIFNMRRRHQSEVQKHRDVMGLDEAVDDVDAARRSRLILEQLEKGAANMAKTLRLFQYGCP